MKTIYRYLSVCGALDQARGVCGDRQIGIVVLGDGAKTMEENSDEGKQRATQADDRDEWRFRRK